MRKSFIAKTLITLFFVSAFVSCKSTRVEPAADATDREIVQMAQTAYDDGEESDALDYYNVLLQRFGMNSAVYVEARFEIAHIYFKDKDYEKAAPIYEELLDLYATAMPGQLPGAYQKLAANDYSKIPADKKRVTLNQAE